jgi:hypothetical protein
VLVAGGWDGRRPTATAELYEAATGHFVAVGRMRAARGSPVAALLSGGRVLIAGGEGDGRPLRTAEIYDPRKRAFVSTRSMSTARGAHSAARLAGGNVLVVGGSDAKGRVLRSAEIFDPRKGRFTRVGPMTTPRYKQAVVALSGGGALVLGGSNALDFRGRYASAEIFSERTRTFRRVGRMANARFKLDASAVALRLGAVLVAGGGEQVEIFNTTRRVFGVIGGTGVRLAFATATRLPDGKVLFAGGYDDNIQVSRRAWLIQA